MGRPFLKFVFNRKTKKTEIKPTKKQSNRKSPSFLNRLENQCQRSKSRKVQPIPQEE